VGGEQIFSQRGWGERAHSKFLRAARTYGNGLSSRTGYEAAIPMCRGRLGISSEWSWRGLSRKCPSFSRNRGLLPASRYLNHTILPFPPVFSNYPTPDS
jgi:hypothetical protein